VAQEKNEKENIKIFLNLKKMCTFGVIFLVPDDVSKFMFVDFGWNMRSFVFIGERCAQGFGGEA
jgi:hypothetical protein